MTLPLCFELILLQFYLPVLLFDLNTLNKVFKKNLLKIVGFAREEPLFFLILLITVFLAVFLRTYNYPGRIGIVADNSQDVQVARFAHDHFKLPLAGPFSSAGPFYYGPWYFWFLEIVSFVPLGLLTHWYVLTFVGLLFVFLIFILGKEVGGKWVGLLAALFAAISPAGVDNSFTVWNPAIVPILSLTALIFLTKFYKKRKALDLFLLCFLVGLSITIHFQSILTLPVIVIASLLIKRSFKAYLVYLPWMLIGFLIPFIPLIYLDIKLNWYNSRSLFVFLAVDQFSSWVPNRWLSYLFSYWPGTWAGIIGGNSLIVIIIVAVVSTFSIFNLPKLKKNAIYFLIATTFFIEIILYRYYRGQRFQYYSYFAHAPVIIISAWGTAKLFQFKKILGAAIIIIVCISTLRASFANFKNQTVTLATLENVKKEIYREFPQKTFDVYGCLANPNALSYPLALLMYNDGRDSLNGMKIGICVNNEGIISWRELTDWDLGGQREIHWYERSTEKVYFDTAEWWQKSPPTKNVNFLEYLKTHLSPRCWPHC